MCQNCGRLVPERFLNPWFDQNGSGVCSAETGRYTAANCRAHIEENRQRAIRQATLTVDPVSSHPNGEMFYSEPDWGDSLDILRSMLGVTHEAPSSQDKRREILGTAMQKLDEHKESMPEQCYLDVANELKKVYDAC